MEAAWGCFNNFLRPLGSILGSLGRLWSVLEGLEAYWHRLGTCLRKFWSLLGRLVGPLEVSSGRFSEPRGCLEGDIAFGVGFLMLCECLGDRFSLLFFVED